MPVQRRNRVAIMFFKALTFSLLAAAVTVSAAAAEDHLQVGVSHLERLPVRGEVSSVIIAAPTIADVTVINGHTLFVVGRGYGVTGVTALDRAGRVVWSGDVTVVAPPSDGVTIWRGVTASQMACAGACSPTAILPPPNSAGSTGGGGLPGGIAGSIAAMGGAPPIPSSAASVQTVNH